MKKIPPKFLAAFILTLGTLICYWPIAGHQFINFDDPQYITNNFHITPGLSWSGIAWAFTSGYACNWHPLTWISHMFDCHVFGVNAGWHHLMNLGFHLGNSLLLLHLLHRMTGSVWRSAFVAALFAWHPLHVESVAWASERKDVLSTLFWILTMLAYVQYVQRPSRARYGLTLCWFALGLMSKPMVVTLPCVLLLMDLWPLRRLRFPALVKGKVAVTDLTVASSQETNSVRPLKFLLSEKIPFFVLALISSMITYLVQQKGGAVSSFEAIPFGARVANAAVAYLGYISKMFWPVNLTPIYPYPSHLPLVSVLSAGLLLVLVSGWFILRLQTQPWLFTGWFWFLGTLIPTIGLIQVGSQSMADRYTYIPSIGFFMLIVWGLAAWAAAKPHFQKASVGIGVFILTGFAVATSLQLRHWRDAESLFRHTLAASSDKYIAYNYLGKAVEDAGRTNEALVLYQKSIGLKPGYAEGEYNVGTLLMNKGELESAVAHFQAALKTHPRYADAHNNLGSAWFKLGRVADAKSQFAKAVSLDPKNPEAHYNLGTVLVAESNFDEAIRQFSEAIQLKPNYAAAHGNLGVALMYRGKVAQGMAHFAEAARLNPRDADARLNLGIALLEHGSAPQASRLLADALNLSPNSPKIHYYLALSLARQHNTSEAIAYAQKARTLALASGQADLAAKAQQVIDGN